MVSFEDKMLNMLLSARANRSDVTVTLKKCIHRCCGGGWQVRNRKDTYNGRITVVERGYTVITSGRLGRINETLIELKDIIHLDVLP